MPPLLPSLKSVEALPLLQRLLPSQPPRLQTTTLVSPVLTLLCSEFIILLWPFSSLTYCFLIRTSTFIQPLLFPMTYLLLEPLSGKPLLRRTTLTFRCGLRCVVCTVCVGLLLSLHFTYNNFLSPHTSLVIKSPYYSTNLRNRLRPILLGESYFCIGHLLRRLELL